MAGTPGTPGTLPFFSVHWPLLSFKAGRSKLRMYANKTENYFQWWTARTICSNLFQIENSYIISNETCIGPDLIHLNELHHILTKVPTSPILLLVVPKKVVPWSIWMNWTFQNEFSMQIRFPTTILSLVEASWCILTSMDSIASYLN